MKTAKRIDCPNCNNSVVCLDNPVAYCSNCFLPICVKCHRNFTQVIENNGFDEPNPTHFETTGYKCTGCELKI